MLDRVETWLGVPDAPEAPRTPLFALAPLIAKNGLRNAWRRHALEFSLFFVAPAKMAGARTRIRQILIAQGTGAVVRRAVEAARLLGTAMTPPHEFFGHTVPPEVVLGWADDDIATVAALRQVAQATNEPLVRRIIRHELEGDATRALSPKLRRAALELVAELDKRVDDDLTKTILGRWVRLLPSRRGITVPEEAADLGEDGDSPAGPGNLGDISAIVDASIAERARNRDAAVASLWREHGPAEIVDVLDERLRAITAAHQSREIQGMIELLGGLGAARPAALPDLVAEAVALAPWTSSCTHCSTPGRSDINAFAIALPPIIAARQGVASAAARVQSSPLGKP